MEDSIDDVLNSDRKMNYNAKARLANKLKLPGIEQVPLYNTSIGNANSSRGQGYKASAITSRHATSINEHDRVFSKDPPSITYSMLVSPK